MTTLASDRSCMFCGLPAWRRPASCELPSHDFDCARCGRYRVSEVSEARMRGTGVDRYAEVLPKIVGANQQGCRLVIPSCYRVPFPKERAVAIATYADRPGSQPHAEELGTRSIGVFADRPVEGAAHPPA